MRRGSLEYWPHRRAHGQLPRVRSWREDEEGSFSGLVAFKAGMTHVGIMDDSLAPSKGSEVIKAVTVLEVPKTYVYGIRFYRKNHYNYKNSAMAIYDETLAANLGIKKVKHGKSELQGIRDRLGEFSDVRALMFAQASSLSFGNKRTVRFEIHVGGKGIGEKLAFIEGWLGKEVKASDIIREGEYVDISSISKGKGWAGVIKRFGVARLPRKATNKVRHVGTLGPWHPPKVTYMVPQSGHLGYNYRTELNKRVLKVGTQADANSVNPSGGYVNYGNVKNDFIMIAGSLPGSSKRLVRLRKALRNDAPAKKIEITYISLTSKQGA
jgi:large subunit ribosomal protein L3